MRKLINVEEHYACQSVNDKIFDYVSKHNLADYNDEYHQLNFGPNKTRIDKAFAEVACDVGEKRIAFMDANDIQHQIVSYDTTSPQNLPAEISIPLCQEANDYVADCIAKYPGRFSALAVLPLADPKAAALELERAVKEKGLVGCMLTGTYNGVFFDSPEFLPIFEKAAELNVPVYLHPAETNSEVAKTYYNNDNWNPMVNALFESFSFGWHVESGISVLRLILSGVFDKFPDLKIISGHWGEVSALWVKSRLDFTLAPQVTGLKKTISEYYKDNIYVSPSGIFDENLFETLRSLVGINNIMWSEDYPQLQVKDTKNILDSWNLSDEEKDKIAYLNAKKLFNI